MAQKKSDPSADQPFFEAVEDPHARYGGRKDRNFKNLAVSPIFQIFLHLGGGSNPQEGRKAKPGLATEMFSDLRAQGLSERILLHQSRKPTGCRRMRNFRKG